MSAGAVRLLLPSRYEYNAKRPVCKVYNRSMNTECDNGISPQIRNDAYSFYFLTDQHNHKDSGKCGNVYLEYVAGIIVGPHTRRGGGEVHYDQCQQDK